MKILVIGPSWVGDMMMSQSLYRTLKANHPEAVIDVMAPAWCRPLLSRMPEVNEALAMPLGHGALAIGERRRLGKSLRARGYDRAYVLPGSFKSALVPFFAGIRQRTGWRGEMRYGLLNDLRVLDKPAFPLMVERYAALAYDKDRIRSARDLPQPLLWPQLQVSEEEKVATAAAFSLTSARPIIGFCPGAEFGPAKRWPHYHYAALAQQLIDQGYQILLFGSAKDHETGEQILQSHFQPDVKAFRHAQFAHHVIQIFRVDVNRARDAHFTRQPKAIVVYISDHHITRADVFTHRRRHNANRPGS